MLRFRNLKWLFNKNTYVSMVLMIIAIGFAIFVNYESISNRLNNNNKLITNYIQGQFNQYKTRLDLVRQSLKIKSLSELKLEHFTSVYFLDAAGNVLSKVSTDSKDHINKFIQINTDTLKPGEIFTSRLSYSKNMRPSIYLAVALDAATRAAALEFGQSEEPEFICARVEITEFLNGVVDFNTPYMVTDSHENILYSSQPELIAAGTNIGSMSNLLSIQGIFDSSSVIVSAISKQSAGFYVRSFIGKREFLSSYLVISLLLLAVFVLCFYSFHMDKKALKIGFIDQINYCFKLLENDKLSDNQFIKALIHNDVKELQSKIAQTMLDFKELKEEYLEIDQRLGSMFSKSNIPMIMIDALSAKIYKANDAALEFYELKMTAMSKMNLYMLACAPNQPPYDPVIFASNLQNCIKNQDGYIKAHHFANAVHKEVKIYTFPQRTDRFNYDTLMIIDSDFAAKSLATLSLKNEALENSFICSMQLGLNGQKLIVEHVSKGLLRYLGNVALNNRELKTLVHRSCIGQLAKLLFKVRRLIREGNIETHSNYETVLHLRQDDGNYSEFNANFVICYSSELEIRLYAVLAHVRADLSSFEVQTGIDYHNIYQNAKEYIAILDSDFRFLSINAALASLINPRAKTLEAVISPRTRGVIDAIKQGSSKENFVELLDSQGKYHSCKFKYLCSKSARGDMIYGVYFQEDFFSPVLGDFAAFMRDSGQDIEEQICEFYKDQKINTYIAQSSLAALSHHEGLDKLKEMYLQALKK